MFPVRKTKRMMSEVFCGCNCTCSDEHSGFSWGNHRCLPRFRIGQPLKCILGSAIFTTGNPFNRECPLRAMTQCPSGGWGACECPRVLKVNVQGGGACQFVGGHHASNVQLKGPGVLVNDCLQ